jgi:predicted Zn-dependent peptidase
VVGDVDPDKTRDMAEQYFGNIPPGEASTFPAWDEKFNKGERRKVVDSPKANVPAVFVGYQIPSHDDPDTPALSLLNDLLVDGESSRLHKRLVKDEEAAFAVFGFMDSRLGAGIFRVIVAANAGVDIKDCESIMHEEIARVQNEGISDDELNKLKVSFKSDFIEGRQTVLNKAEAIHHYVRFHSDLSDINTDLDRYLAVTADDIQRVASKYLVESNRVAVTALPTSS